MNRQIAVNHPASYRISLSEPDDFEEWRGNARALVQAGVAPDCVTWDDPASPGADLFAQPGDTPPAHVHGRIEPRASLRFVQLAQTAILHTDPERFSLLYRVLWRLQQTPRLMDDASDPDVRRVEGLARAVRRDMHKMRAFVRFRSIMDADGLERFVAWFEPEHHILRANAGFFVRRFASMRWSILTPRGTLHWDMTALFQGPPASRADAPNGDPIEALWRGYYASIFNPARLKVGAMLKEMPRRYWKNMPEAQLIPGLVATAQARETAMVANGASEAVDRPGSLQAIATAIQTCQRCAIGCNGTRAVAGEGPGSAPLMMVGEQPGDMEERQGRPFVGPAGQLLRGHLEHAGLSDAETYVTNAVKHFKFVPQGKRRLHQSPTAGEIDKCRWWLDSERALVKPRLILALGASAARGILGRTVSVQKERGRAHPLDDGTELWITTHPSYLLRLRDDGRAVEEQRFSDDLRKVALRLKETAISHR